MASEALEGLLWVCVQREQNAPSPQFFNLRPVSEKRLIRPYNGVMKISSELRWVLTALSLGTPRSGSDDYFDRTAEIEEAIIVLPGMVPCAVTI